MRESHAKCVRLGRSGSEGMTYYFSRLRASPVNDRTRCDTTHDGPASSLLATRMAATTVDGSASPANKAGSGLKLLSKAVLRSIMPYVFKSLSPVLSQVVSWYGCFLVSNVICIDCDVHIAAENKSTWALKTKPRDGVWSFRTSVYFYVYEVAM